MEPFNAVVSTIVVIETSSYSSKKSMGQFLKSSINDFIEEILG